MEMNPSVKINQAMIITTLILIGLNLRPSMSAIGPLLPFIQHDLPFSYTKISLLTMLPVLAMGLVMFISRYLTRLFSPYTLVTLSLIIIGSSNFFRLFIHGNEYRLIITAITAGCGIAIIQAILPTVIKKNFPHSVALYMGLYVTAIMAGAALAASLVSPIEHIFKSWEIALSIWSILAFFALAAWFKVHATVTHQNNNSIAQVPQFKVYNIRRTWLLGLFFGLGTASYTCILAWLPPYYLEFGWSNTQAGLLLAALTGVEVIAGLFFPAWANRSEDRRPLLLIIIFCALIGYAGLIFAATTAPLLWVFFLGLGIGGLFPMSLIVTMDHYRDPQQAGELTAFVQGIGYVLAAFSPLFAGMIRDQTHSFTLSWAALFILTMILLLIAPQFNPKNYKKEMSLHY